MILYAIQLVYFDKSGKLGRVRLYDRFFSTFIEAMEEGKKKIVEEFADNFYVLELSCTTIFDGIK